MRFGVADEVAVDTLLAGRVQLAQPVRGQKVGTDAILLAATLPPGVFDALDLGAGVGSVGLIALAGSSQLRVTLVEIDPFTAGLARDNLQRNGWEARARVIEVDALDPGSRRNVGLADESAGWVLSNPPFYDPGRTRVSPDPRRRLAHAGRAQAGFLDDWCRAMAALTAPDGGFSLIHRADALNAVLTALQPRFGDLAIRPVYPRVDEPAIRVLVTGRKGSRAPLKIAPGLVLHETDGRFTPLAAALHRGAASLSV